MTENTKVIRDTFKGNATIGIWKVDANGNIVGKAPIISFGYNKAKAIATHMQELLDWVAQQEQEQQSKRSATITATVTATASSSGTSSSTDAGTEALTSDELAVLRALLFKTKASK